MEVKINKEIRNYTESMFFGLSLSYLAIEVLGEETSSEWCEIVTNEIYEKLK